MTLRLVGPVSIHSSVNESEKRKSTPQQFLESLLLKRKLNEIVKLRYKTLYGSNTESSIKYLGLKPGRLFDSWIMFFICVILKCLNFRNDTQPMLGLVCFKDFHYSEKAW